MRKPVAGLGVRGDDACAIDFRRMLKPRLIDLARSGADAARLRRRAGSFRHIARQRRPFAAKQNTDQGDSQHNEHSRGDKQQPTILIHGSGAFVVFLCAFPDPKT